MDKAQADHRLTTRCSFALGPAEEVDFSATVAAGVEVLDFDCSLRNRPVLVAVKDKYISVSGTAKELLLAVREGGIAGEDIPLILGERSCDEETRNRIQKALTGLADVGIIEFTASPAMKPPNVGISRQRAIPYFVFKVLLLSERILYPITRAVSPLFQVEFIQWSVPIMLVLQSILWWSHFRAFIGLAGSLNGWDYAILLVGNYVGLFLHEIGHAAACIKGGVRHGPIGFGIYLIFPAFYADVSPAWRLPRTARMVVDIGGIYMSLLAATTATISFYVSGKVVFGVLASAYNLTVWVSLWPFIRMDGYWLLSDFLGVPNLMATNRDLSRFLWSKLRGRGCPRPATLDLEPHWRGVLYHIYYSLFVLSLAWMVYLVSRWYFPMLIKYSPETIRQLWLEVRLHIVSLKALQSFVRLLFMLVPLVGLSHQVRRILGFSIARVTSRLGKIRHVEGAGCPH